MFIVNTYSIVINIYSLYFLCITILIWFILFVSREFSIYDYIIKGIIYLTYFDIFSPHLYIDLLDLRIIFLTGYLHNTHNFLYSHGSLLGMYTGDNVCGITCLLYIISTYHLIGFTLFFCHIYCKLVFIYTVDFYLLEITLSSFVLTNLLFVLPLIKDLDLVLSFAAFLFSVIYQ